LDLPGAIAGHVDEHTFDVVEAAEKSERELLYELAGNANGPPGR